VPLLFITTIIYINHSIALKKRGITLFKSTVIPIFLAFLLSACSSSSSDPSLTREQAQQEEDELRDRCKKLQQDIEDLKGRPVRRGAALEYYQNECVHHSEPFPADSY
jgi:hypothetical protein